MDLLKSLFTWIFYILFLTILFPFKIIVFLLVVLPTGKKQIIHSWLMFEGLALIRLSPLWTIKIEGRENYDHGQTYVMVSNHQSMLDIPVIHCLNFSFLWVSKIENFKVPILGLSMKMAGYIAIERGNKESVVKMMQESEDALKSGHSLFLFPEGTRSKDKNIKRFKTGSFRLALNTGLPVLPVLIDGTGQVLPKKGIVFSSGHNLRVKVLKPIKPEDFGTDDPDILAEKIQVLLTRELDSLRQETAQNRLEL